MLRSVQQLKLIRQRRIVNQRQVTKPSAGCSSTEEHPAHISGAIPPQCRTTHSNYTPASASTGTAALDHRRPSLGACARSSAPRRARARQHEREHLAEREHQRTRARQRRADRQAHAPARRVRVHRATSVTCSAGSTPPKSTGAHRQRSASSIEVFPTSASSCPRGVPGRIQAPFGRVPAPGGAALLRLSAIPAPRRRGCSSPSLRPSHEVRQASGCASAC